MQEQIMGLVRDLFRAIFFRNYKLADSVLAEAEAAGLLQQLLTTVHYWPSRGITVLQAAAFKGNNHLVTALLAAGAPVEAAEADGATALILAAREGHVETVRVLVSRGASVHAATSEGVTGLMVAARRAHVDVVRELLAADADVLANGAFHTSATKALHAAVIGGSAAVLGQLLQHVQLSPSTADIYVDIAVARGHGHLLQQLFEAGADRGAALRFAASNPSATATATASSGIYAARALKILQDLLSAGVSVDAMDEKGETALHVAASHQSVQGMQMLLEAGAAADARSNRGFTALRYAAGSDADSKACAAKVGLLIQAGAPASVAAWLEEQQQGHHTPLVFAACKGSTAVAQALCKHLAAEAPAADQLQDLLGPALQAVLPKGHAGVVRVLLQAGANPLRTVAADSNVHATALRFAALQANPAVIECFVQHCSPEQLTPAVLVEAAAAAAAAARARDLDPEYAEAQPEAAQILMRAAADRLDAESIYAELQLAAGGGSGTMRPDSLVAALGPFAQVMLSMWCGFEHKLGWSDHQQHTLQQMCLQLAQHLAAGREPSE